MIRLYCTYLFLLILFSACKKGEKIPSYLEIPAVVVVEGSDTLTSKITDVWVYANEQLLGSWELPARIPVLHEGTTSIQVSPAIKRNGMFDDRDRYPFYSWWRGSVDLQLKETTVLRPNVDYVDELEVWTETFEEPGFQLVVSQESDSTLLRFTPTEHPEVQQLPVSTAAGGFVLDQSHPYLRAYSDEDFAPTGGPMYLEIDFSTTVQLTIGVLFVQAGTAVASPFVYLTPTADSNSSLPTWNKVYIDLSPVFNLGVSQRDFYIEASAPASGTARIYLDNLKLVRFQ